MPRLDSRIISDLLHRAHKHTSQALRNVWGKLKIHGTLEGTSDLILKDLGAHADTPPSGKGAIYVNGDTPYFKTDGGVATSMIAGGSGASAPLTLTNSSTSGSPALTIDNNDTDKIALSIDAANIDADVIDITADAVTTAYVMDVTADALTFGGILNLVSDSPSEAQRSLVSIHNDNTAATGTTLLHLLNDAAGKVMLFIEGANTTSDVIQVNADSLTTAYVMDVTADALTTGGILNLVSDSSNTGNRTLVKVHNDNTAATGVQMVHFLNDAIGGADDPILMIESTAVETHPILELKNSNASTNAEPILNFYPLFRYDS